jgi:hypothetical protein
MEYVESIKLFTHLIIYYFLSYQFDPLIVSRKIKSFLDYKDQLNSH